MFRFFPVNLLRSEISQWLGLDFSILESAYSQSNSGRFSQLLQWLITLRDISSPPLEQWCTALEIRKVSNPSKTLGLRRTEPPGRKPEDRLERAIAKPAHGDWFNQVPLGSGYASAAVPGELETKAIDLALRLGDGHFRLVELKAILGTNNPVYAACELTRYGLVYLWHRRHLHGLPNSADKLIKALRIELQVLAPREYYTVPAYPLDKLLLLETRLNDAFAGVGAGNPEMSFSFGWVDFPVETQLQKEMIESGADLSNFAAGKRLNELLQPSIG